MTKQKYEPVEVKGCLYKRLQDVPYHFEKDPMEPFLSGRFFKELAWYGEKPFTKSFIFGSVEDGRYTEPVTLYFYDWDGKILKQAVIDFEVKFWLLVKQKKLVEGEHYQDIHDYAWYLVSEAREIPLIFYPKKGEWKQIYKKGNK